MAWVTTKDGRRVNTDWFDDDEKKKYKQIEKNKQEADRLNGKTLNGIPITKDGALPDSFPFKTYLEGTEWIADTLDVSQEEAENIHEAISAWSDYGSKDIHNNSDEKNYFFKSGKERTEYIDKYLNNSNVPKYSGDLYRGLNSKPNNREQLDKMLESGLWKEPGITGFSYDKDQANLYTLGSTGSDKVTIILKNNTHAATIGHLSIGGGEKEALYPSSIKNGIKIASFTKTPVYFNKVDRKHFKETGERRFEKKLLNYEYEIILDDKRR